MIGCIKIKGKYMKWLIQDTHRLLNIVNQELTALSSLNKSFSVFGVLENENVLTGLYEEDFNDTNYIFRCGVKVINMLSTGKVENINQLTLEKLKESISYDFSNFDQKVYSKLDLPLLNNSAVYEKFESLKNKIFDRDMFIKPSSDLKCFTAGILKAGTNIEDYILSTHYQKGYKDETILLDEVKSPGTEFRFVCFGNEAIAGSSYLKDGKLKLDEKVDKELLSIASEFAKLYNPSDIFVMDLAKKGNDFKIVEYNCWNASGLYNIDMVKLFEQVEEYKKPLKRKLKY